TRSNQHSFQPRWRPPFVTALAPEDRCHLNGLGLAPDDDGREVVAGAPDPATRPDRRAPATAARQTSGRAEWPGPGNPPQRRVYGRLVPRFVTALGTSDTCGGWRANKRNGGVLLDVPSGETITAGLSMPHSPRWHDGRLWVLESGSGGIGHVDLATG